MPLDQSHPWGAHPSGERTVQTQPLWATQDLRRVCGDQVKRAEGEPAGGDPCQLWPHPADEPRTNDQEARPPPGDQAPDLHFLVAGAGFEPATSGVMSQDGTVQHQASSGGPPSALPAGPVANGLFAVAGRIEAIEHAKIAAGEATSLSATRINSRLGRDGQEGLVRGSGPGSSGGHRRLVDLVLRVGV